MGSTARAFKHAPVWVDAVAMNSSTTAITPTRPSTGAELAVPAATRRATAWRWLGDIVSMSLIASILWWWADHDGGRPPRALLTVSAIAIVMVPWATAELRRVPRAAQWLIAAWAGGAVLSVLVAPVRAGFPVPTAVIGLTVFSGLAAHRVWRRPWGPLVILTVALFAFGAYWYRSFLQWWGHAMFGETPRFMALSWHNQSGTLMGAFAALFAGLALRGRQLLGVAGVVASGTALSAAWLSTSRAAASTTLAALVAVTIVAMRGQRFAAVVARLSAVAALAASVTIGMTAFALSAGGERPTGASIDASHREANAATNLRLRVEHMEAAVGMFVDRPIAGQGLGGYRWSAPQWTDPNANLTSSAHNEYLESFAEGGLIVGGPLVLLVAAIGAMVTYRMRFGVDIGTGHDVDLDDVRGAVLAGCVGVAVALGLHAAVDFDWDFPVLPMFLAVGVAVMSASTDTQRGVGTRVGMATAATAITAALAMGTTGMLVEHRIGGPAQSGLSAEKYAAAPAPWDIQAVGDVARTLGANGEHQLAVAAVDRGLRWNPGVESLRTVRAVAAYGAGSVSASEVASTLAVGEVPFWAFNYAAEALIAGGDREAAHDVLETALAAYPRYEAWRVGDVEARSRELLDIVKR